MLLRREGGDSTSCAGQGMLAKDLSSSKCRRSIDLLGLATAGRLGLYIKTYVAAVYTTHKPFSAVFAIASSRHMMRVICAIVVLAMVMWSASAWTCYDNWDVAG